MERPHGTTAAGWAGDLALRGMLGTLRRVMRPATVRIDGLRVPVDRAWPPAILRALDFGSYELPERMAVRALVGRSDRVLELGAAIGVVGSAILRARPAMARHYEANPALIPHARATFAANGEAAPDLRCAAVVGGGHDGGTATLHVGQAFWGSGLAARRSSVGTVEVPAIRFTEVLDDFRPTVIVMDVEGAECALLGEAPPGALAGVRAVSVETHPAETGNAAVSAMLARLLAEGLHLDLGRSRGRNLVLRRDLP